MLPTALSRRSLACRRFILPVLHNPFSTIHPPSTRIYAIAEALKSSKDLVSIHDHSAALVQEIKKANVQLVTTSQPPQGEDYRLVAILHLLASSGRPEDMEKLEHILRFQHLLGSKPSPNIYTSIIDILLENHHDEQLMDFLLRMPQLPGYKPLTLEQLHAIIQACGKFSTQPFLFNFVVNMTEMGQNPTNGTFAILLDRFWNVSVRMHGVPDSDQLIPIIDEMAHQNLAYDSAIADLLYHKFNEAGRPEVATKIVQRYEATLSNTKSISGNDHSSPTEGDTIISQSDDNALARSALHRSKNLNDIRAVEEGLGIQCGTEHWAIAVANLLKSQDPESAFRAYEQAKKAGVLADSKLVLPLLTHLLRDKKRGSSDASIDLAMILYHDLATAHPAPPTSPLQSAVSSLGPTLPIYRTLLRILISSSNKGKSFPLVESLLTDMETRGIPTTGSDITAITIIIEMRKAGNFKASLDFYREHRQNLDERGFNAVLREHCRLGFRGDLLLPFIQEYFSIVHDMRLQRVPITPQVYTTVLFYIGNMATRLQRDDPFSSRTAETLQRLVVTTRRAHDFLTLDASISPDAALWNQLMNTYQRLGCFADSYRVWEMMYLTGRFDQISVSIILDACGFAGQLQVANRILSRLSRTGFAFDIHNMNTWIECLCRIGKFETATSVLCFDIEKYGLRPNTESVRILWKFARKEGMWEKLQPLIVKHQLSLWEQLPNDIQNS